MEVLATNITHKDPNHSNVDDISRCIVFFLSAALILYGTCFFWRVLPSEIVWLVLLMFANVLFAVYGGLVYLNKYLRWNRTTETISVQHETLVIKCHGCIFHHTARGNIQRSHAMAVGPPTRNPACRLFQLTTLPLRTLYDRCRA